MQNLSPVFFNDNDADKYEDVDKLFSKLEQYEPPSDMVARIMNIVSKLPPPQQLQRQSSVFPELDGLIVRNDEKEPS